MLRINIDGKELQAFPGQTVLEVAQTAGILIPTLCHNERLKTYGGCGLCVVEMEGSKNLFRACSTMVEDGMAVITDTPRLRSSRQTTLSLLLSDHSGDCKGPCVLACPAQTDVQGYVGLIANGLYQDAVKLIKEKLPIPASIGRICPHPCEAVCRRQLVEQPISIAYLKYFAADKDLRSGQPFRPRLAPSSEKKVAVVGAGPAGLTAAYYLAVMGHAVTVYDAMPRAGGMLRYGIPEYRLPKDVLDQEISLIADLGVQFQFNCKIGRDISLPYLTTAYDAVFVGIGAWKSSPMRCEGENQPGVFGGIDFLRMVATGESVEIGQRVAIVGGGNTAMDAARTAVRLGAEEVMVLYRRTRAEMPAEDIEIKEAEEEGVVFHYLVAPLEVLGTDGRASAVRLQKMELGAPDSSGRRSPVPIDGDEETIMVDSVISAIGQAVNSAGIEGIELDKWGSPRIDSLTMQCSDPRVFAGGDGVTGPGIAITAVAHGRRAALGIDAFLKGQPMPEQSSYLVERLDASSDDYLEIPKEGRLSMSHRTAGQRRISFTEVNYGFSEAEALQEAGRCLECGCKDYFECQLIENAQRYDANPGQLEGEKHHFQIINEHPFIERNMEKCILCGQCIRICEEVMGPAALGLVGRGFESVVVPEFGLPLKESSCISCGQCVFVCPTGALVEKHPLSKTIPLKTEECGTACALCGMGCAQTVHLYGSTALKIEPAGGGLLCSKGRFAFEYWNRDRIKIPMIKKNGELVEASWEEALTVMGRSLKSIRRVAGSQACAISFSPLLSMEEAFLLKSFAVEALECSQHFSFTRNTSRGLEAVLGENRPVSSLDELIAADFILAVGSLNQSQIAAVKIRQAVQNGAQMVLISNEPGLLDDLASTCLYPEDGLQTLKEIIAALISNDLVNTEFIEKYCTGYEELKHSLQSVEPSAAAEKLARLYAAARRAIIVADGSTLSRAAVESLAQITVLCGRVGSPRNGITVVHSDANQVGQWALQIRDCFHQHMNRIRNGEIQALIIAGEDPVGAGLVTDSDLARIKCLVAISPFRTATTDLADIVLPGSLPVEAAGTFVNYSGRTRKTSAVFQPPAGVGTLEAIGRVAEWFDILLPEPSFSTALEDMNRALYYQNGINDIRSYRLNPVEGQECFMPVFFADPVKRLFAARLAHEGLDRK